MAGNVLDGAFDEFRAAAGEIAANATFLDRAASLRPRVGRYLAWDGLVGEDKALVQQFMNSGCSISVCYEGLFVRLVASFEGFVRRAVKDAVLSLNESKICFAKLEEGIRNRNRHCVGRALATVYEPMDFLQLDFDRLCLEVGTCVPNATSVTLSADAFAMAVGSASVDRIEAAFRLLGKNLQWGDFAGNEALKKVLETRKPRETAKAAQNLVADIQARRNGYAHTGIGGVFVTVGDIEATASFLILLADALKEQLGTHLVALCGR
ncbi:MAG TPA: hypothetical protein VNA25_06350 [Phycisphaerae bacterium]|nr:hypothetical protein [Phycisphaerae bacterium]